jgi:1-acyl-sn-glycerol-3-phosphate acyltransferase
MANGTSGGGHVMRWVKHSWKVLCKGIALAFIFGGGGLVTTIALPMMMLPSGSQCEHVQLLIHRLFRLYLRLIVFVGLIRLDIDDEQKLAACGGKIVIANHPSLLDVVILMACIPRTQCIVKHELWSHRFLGGLMRGAGYISNDLDPERLVASCKDSLNDGRTLIIFPEGTRTALGEPPHFQRGFANIATLTDTDIQPVFITCHPPFLYKGESWWRYPPQKPVFRVSVGESLDARSYSLYGQRSVAARKLVNLLEDYYGKQIRNGQS